MIHNQADTDKVYLYGKNLLVGKYQYLINKLEKVDWKHYNDPKVFIEYSNDMQDVYKNFQKFNLGKKRKVLIFLIIGLLIWLITKN